MMQDLVLLPGLLCDARLFAAQIEALSGKARCAVPDLSPYHSITAMADAVLAAAPPRFAVAGFSMGGYVALEIMKQGPGRVSRLALLSTTTHALPAPVAKHLGDAIAGIRAGEFEAYIEHAYPLYVAPARIDDTALRATFVAMARDQGADAAIGEITALMSAPDHSDLPPMIACPAAVICGALDQRTPVALHRAFAAAIPGATLTIVAGAGHFTPLEKPDRVSAALASWLDR
ncbi:MAG: alpha/beta fold hydrolase [Alphaproteobacteria bacterium]|nr:alpha/beta fold hydrolase [Alphaproteobacteria bacterium]